MRRAPGATSPRWPPRSGRDATRPLHYEGDQSCADLDVWSRMYPSHADVEAVGRGEELSLDDPDLDARRRAMPFVLCEYAHAMGTARAA